MRSALRGSPAGRLTLAGGATLLAGAIAGVIGMALPPAAGATTVRVQAGANLSQIARAYGTTVAALAQVNGIADPNLVVAGTVLQIPPAASGTAGTAATGTSTAAGAVAAGSTTVVVARGDTLWAIAQRYGTTVAALAQVNDIADPGHVVIGTRLAVPGQSAVTSPSTSTASTTGAAPAPVAAAGSSSRSALLPTFHRWAAAFGVPPALLEALCWWESGWQASVVSSTGAVGVGQLEPSTVRTLRLTLGNQALSPTDPSDNIEMAAAYLHQLLVQTAGSESLALAGYYQGLLSVRQHGLLPSTTQYVRGILALAASFG